jgi:hypothetical protein
MTNMNWDAVIAIGTLLGVLIALMDLLASIVLGVGLYWVAAKASKIDKLEENLTTKAGELVDAKFATLSAEMEVPMTKLSTIIDEMKRRLDLGDGQFDAQAEAAHALELKNSLAIKDLEIKVGRDFATKQELGLMEVAVEKMREALSHCQGICKNLAGEN